MSLRRGAIYRQGANRRKYRGATAKAAAGIRAPLLPPSSHSGVTPMRDRGRDDQVQFVSRPVARILCGSTMTCEGESLPEIQFHIGTFTFEDASRLRPTKQFFPEERLPWVHPTDDAPR